VARITSGTLITGLVAAALVAVGALAADAAMSAPGYPLAAAGTSVGSASRPAGGAGAGAGQQAPPADSGAGERVVYSIGRARVWLVTADERVARSYRVLAGDPAPELGTHEVFARRAKGEGGDGTKVEHVVLFAETDGMNIGFSAAVDGSLDPPAPAQPNTAVRQRRADADALWQQATIGSPVEVIP
jgi:hypothetical protein